jgi:hypothetical protein
MIVKATLKTRILDGIEIMDASVGKEYLIELDSRTKIDWFNLDYKHGRKIEAVIDVVNGGWLPVEVLDIS